MFTFCQTRCGACRCDSFVNYFGMSLSIDNLLCHENLVTNGAVLAFRQACFGTSRCDRLVDDLGMALHSDGFGLRSPANRTSIGLNAGCRTCRLCCNFAAVITMTCCIGVSILVAVTTIQAGMGRVTLFRTCRCSNLTCVAVTCCGN